MVSVEVTIADNSQKEEEESNERKKSSSERRIWYYYILNMWERKLKFDLTADVGSLYVLVTLQWGYPFLLFIQKSQVFYPCG